MCRFARAFGCSQIAGATASSRGRPGTFTTRPVPPVHCKTQIVRATLKGHVIAESDDVEIDADDKDFRAFATRLDLPQKAPKTAADHAWPHEVQFYDVVIDGARYERAS
jgi:hypothetical protein